MRSEVKRTRGPALVVQLWAAQHARVRSCLVGATAAAGPPHACMCQPRSIPAAGLQIWHLTSCRALRVCLDAQNL